MTEKITSQEEKVVQLLYSHAAGLMKSGYSDWQIKTNLVEQGLDQESASIIVENLRKLRNQALKKAALRNIVIGGLVCLAGLIVTINTYMSARGGRTYVIAYGAIIFGAIRFFQGLSEYSE